MGIVVDFAWTKPTVAQLESWDAVACGMYVSHDPSKNATPGLIAQYAAAHIKSFLFFEDGAQNAAGGSVQGVIDSEFAFPLAASYGMPSWAPIVVSVDFDVPDYAPNSTDPMAKLGPVGAYLQAWCSKFGKARVAVYGDYYVCQRAISAGVASYGVQTIAWSGGQVDTTNIVALQNGQQLDSGQVDIETIESAQLLNFLAWVPGEANPHVAPTNPAWPTPTGLQETGWTRLDFAWDSVAGTEHAYHFDAWIDGTTQTLLDASVIGGHASIENVRAGTVVAWRVAVSSDAEHQASAWSETKKVTA